MTGNLPDRDHCALVRLIEILAPSKTIVLFWETYFDESDSHDGAAALSVAAYLFEKEACKALDLEWKVVLEEFDLPFFHMVDCAHGNKPFDKLSRTDRIDVQTRLIRIIRTHMLFGAAITVDERDYNTWAARVRVMGDVTGPISTLPGALHELPKDAKCDEHPDRDAVANIQGETDSFGCETLYCCRECADEIRASLRSPEARTGMCEWCKSEATDLRDTRDHDEGLCGRVYRVCGGCRRLAAEEATAELEELGFDDCDDDDWGD